MSAMSATITVNDVGPIERLEIPVPEQGGLVVLRGSNGSGKSRTLEAVRSLVTGNGSLDVRDGAKRGEVEGFGARITVGRSTRRTGELEVLTLESRLDVADLVDPGVKDPAAADARRIKALVALSGRQADVSAFHGLVGGPEAFGKLVKPETLKTSDPVELAARVKRDLEAAARAAEGEAEKQTGQAIGYRKAAEGIDLTAESDGAKLQAGLEAAIQQEAEFRQRVRTALEARNAAQVAEQRLAEARAGNTGPSVLEAEEAADAAMIAYDQRLAETREARAKLEAAEQAERLAKQEAQAAAKALSQAKSYAALEASARQAIEQAAGVQAPDTEAVIAAVDAVSRARRALENGAAIRRARQQLEAAEEADALARKARRTAERLRDAARGTDDVLSQLVACPTLRVEGGRLVTDTDRGVEPYSELSEGERWRLALDLAIDRLDDAAADGQHVSRLLTVPQEAFEGLDFQNRRAIHEHAVARRVVILTAEATEGELAVAEYQAK